MAYAYLYKVRGIPSASESFQNETGGFTASCGHSTKLVSPGEIRKEVDRITAPIVAGTVNMMVPYDSPAALNLRAGNSVLPSYYGSMLDTSEVIPPPKLLSEFKWREKPKSSMKSWGSAKERGDIVFKPLSVGSYTAISNPGLDAKYHDGSSVRILYPRDMTSFMPVYSGPCALGPNRMAMPDGRAAMSTDRKVDVMVERLRFDDTRFLYLEDLYPGLAGVIDSFVRGITPQKEACFDRGLSTSVICEANAGAWDIATEVAEALRETIPSIINACAHIVRKYLEVRKKIKVLRKNSISESHNLATLKADIAALWLNFRYGIGPLAYSIQDGLAYLEYQQQKYQTYRDGASKAYHFEHEDLVGSVKVTHRCVVRDLFDPALLGRYNTSGLKINFYDTAWQLLSLIHI